jgi:hypothetical protein
VNASTNTDDIAVIQARLPYTDRRALSEAWFSVLRRASNGAREEDVGASAGVKQELIAARYFRTERRNARCEPQCCVGLRRSLQTANAHSSDGGGAAETERLRAGRAMTQKGAARETLRESVSHATFTTVLDGARATLHVRRDAEKTTVIAVCSARHAERVRRALAEAAVGMSAR